MEWKINTEVTKETNIHPSHGRAGNEHEKRLASFDP